MTSNNDKHELVLSRNQSNLEDQIEAMTGQDQRACKVDSALSLQLGQRSSRTIFLFFKFSKDGNEFEPALQSRVLTRLGTHKPQTTFQMLLVVDKSEVDKHALKGRGKLLYDLSRHHL